MTAPIDREALIKEATELRDVFLTTAGADLVRRMVVALDIAERGEEILKDLIAEQVRETRAWMLRAERAEAKLTQRDATDKAYWGDQDDEHTPAIRAANPWDTEAWKVFDTAVAMVGVRNSKYALVNLTNWLLARAETAESRVKELESADAEIPDNDRLQFVGGVGRKVKIGKHQAVNYAQLKQTVEALDAAGFPKAADTIIWLVWFRILDHNREEFLIGNANERRDAAEAKVAEQAERIAEAVEWFERHRPQWGPGTLPIWYVDAPAALARARGEVSDG